MTQTERRRFLLSRLLAEAPEYRQLAVPDDAAGQKQLLRALLNVCSPQDVGQGNLTGAGRMPAQPELVSKRPCTEARCSSMHRRSDAGSVHAAAGFTLRRGTIPNDISPISPGAEYGFTDYVRPAAFTPTTTMEEYWAYWQPGISGSMPPTSECPKGAAVHLF